MTLATFSQLGFSPHYSVLFLLLMRPLLTCISPLLCSYSLGSVSLPPTFSLSLFSASSPFWMSLWRKQHRHAIISNTVHHTNFRAGNNYNVKKKKAKVKVVLHEFVTIVMIIFNFIILLKSIFNVIYNLWLLLLLSIGDVCFQHTLKAFLTLLSKTSRQSSQTPTTVI